MAAKRKSVVLDESTSVAWFPADREYRIVHSDVETGEVGGVEFSVTTTEVGERVVWVDEAPDDQSDGTGHFEVYKGADDEYAAQVNPDGEAL